MVGVPLISLVRGEGRKGGREKGEEEWEGWSNSLPPFDFYRCVCNCVRNSVWDLILVENMYQELNDTSVNIVM